MWVFRSKLTKRYVFVSMIIAIVSLSLIYVLATTVLNVSIKERIKERNQLMAKSMSKQAEITLEKTINELHGISPLTISQTEVERTNLLIKMEQIVTKNPLLFHIQAFDEDGNSTASVPEMNYGLTQELEDIIYRLSWSKTYYLSNVIEYEENKYTVALGVPSIDDQENFRGGIIALVDLQTLSNYFNEMKIGNHGMNVMLDRQMNIFAHNDPALIGRNLNNHPLSDLLNKGSFGSWEGILINKSVLVAYRQSDTGAFSLIVGEPLSQGYDAIYKVQKVLFEGFSIILLVAIISTFLATVRIVKPINDLIIQTKHYKNSNNHKSDVSLLKTKDELQDLSFTLHDMAIDLINAEKRLSTILESIPYAVITMNALGEIVTFNKGAEKLTGLTSKVMVGRTIDGLQISISKTDEILTWNMFMEGSKLNELEAWILDKESHKQDVSVYSAWIDSQKTSNIRAILILRNVSEMKKLEGFLKQSERLASLGQLTAGIAHEIRNPLSIIQVAAETIQIETTEDKLDQHLIKELSVDILETTDRLNMLLTDFLQMAKDEKNDTLEPVNLVKLIDGLIHLLMKKFEEQSTCVIKKYNGLSEMYVFACENKLEQVFLNILINSLQAMPMSNGSIQIRMNDLGSEWEVAISDSGEGIPPAKLKWIFNPFYTTKKEGTGLGLSIAYEIILQSKGNIRAESNVGEGTTIFISLPKYTVKET